MNETEKEKEKSSFEKEIEKVEDLFQALEGLRGQVRIECLLGLIAVRLEKLIFQIKQENKIEKNKE